MPFKDDDLQAVLKALNNEKYQWRTVGGVAHESGLSTDKVVEVLDQSGDLVVRSRIPSKSGAALFTTRERLRSQGLSVGKLIAAFRNRAV